ncbi:hypothetical protein Krac_0098 [Ktedonobacter racemifer DSM 44963]|uniref:Uncharacterized protein n=1 Tax=Ktedonobacter racemifer DSM 44963 TaxID=485913 RepID=D6U8R0_KTERA|nr:hypothetical protein Krac_0098 [Ktedonobacter racemifer DSM 44963]
MAGRPRRGRAYSPGSRSFPGPASDSWLLACGRASVTVSWVSHCRPGGAPVTAATGHARGGDRLAVGRMLAQICYTWCIAAGSPSGGSAVCWAGMLAGSQALASSMPVLSSSCLPAPRFRLCGCGRLLSSARLRLVCYSVALADVEKTLRPKLWCVRSSFHTGGGFRNSDGLLSFAYLITVL